MNVTSYLMLEKILEELQGIRRHLNAERRERKQMETDLRAAIADLKDTQVKAIARIEELVKSSAEPDVTPEESKAMADEILSITAGLKTAIGQVPAPPPGPEV